MDTAVAQSERGSQSLLLDALREAGADVSKPKAMRCPFHDDTHPSAGVYEKDGVWRFKCQAGSCGVNYDVYDVRARVQGKAIGDVLPKSEPEKPAVVYPTVDAIRRSFSHVTAVYTYGNPDTGKPELVIVRRDIPGGKNFTQFTPAPGGFVAKGPKVKPLYNRSRVRAADAVVFVEGEKCVHALHDIGIVATTAPGGCKVNKAEVDFSPLAGKRVTLWPDNDPGGIEHAKSVVNRLESLTPPANCFWLDPAELDLPDKGDCVDYIANVDANRAVVEATIATATPIGPGSEIDQFIADAISGKLESIDWPVRKVNRLTRALLPGRVTALCADPASGKSLMMLQCAMHWHISGYKVAVYMLEDDRGYHLMRAFAQTADEAGLTDPQWVKENPQLAKDNAAAYREQLTGFGKCITDAPDDMPSLNDVAGWVRQQASAGARIIIIDPVTAAKTSDKPWHDDLAFVMTCKNIARSHGCSVILVTHPRKGGSSERGGSKMDDMAGGASYQRFTHTVLWLELHEPPKDVRIKTSAGPTYTQANRIMRIAKARNGPGTGAKIAMHFDRKTLKFKTLGTVNPERKTKGVNTDV